MESTLRPLYDLDAAFPEGLDRLLHDKEYVSKLRQLPEPEIFELVDHLNEILIRLDRTGGSSRKCLHLLRKICGSRKILPTNYELSSDVLLPDGPPKAQGGFCDAYEGTLSVKVFIKRLRITADEEAKVKEHFCKEAIVWKHLTHPNIVPFRGVTLAPLQLISEWMPGGELGHYVRSNPDANHFGLVLGAALGLAYLHSKGVIHGDFKGPNIMVDELGNPRITDFGLAKIVRSCNSILSTSQGQGQSLRWTAPEMLESNEVVGKQSDVYSFGMVIIEIFTGEVPFKEALSSEVVMRVIKGERPGRPSHPKFTDHLWWISQRCWTKATEDRPVMEEVVKELKSSGDLPTRLEESPGLTGNPLSMISPQLVSGNIPPVRSPNDGEALPFPYLVDGSDPGSELPPLPPQKDDGDSRTTQGHIHNTTSGGTKGPSSGRLSECSTNKLSEKGSGNGEGQSSPESPSDKSKKKHGLWCGTKNTLQVLKCSVIRRWVAVRSRVVR